MSNMSNVMNVEMDRKRYTKNKLSANLVLGAILFDVLYFVSLYQSDVGSYYYNILIGASVIYNLVFLLAAFLCSEGVKSRKGNYMPALIIMGALQIVRIFIIPAAAHGATMVIRKETVQVMTDGQYWYMIGNLVLSSLCCFAAGVTSFVQNKKLNDYLKTL